MKPRIPISKKAILFSILFVAAFGTFQKICQWDIADKELAHYPKSISVLLFWSGKYSYQEAATNIRRAQTYVVIPLSFDLPFTVSIRSDNGIITVDDDKYGALKLLLLFVILSVICKKFDFSRIKIKGEP